MGSKLAMGKLGQNGAECPILPPKNDKLAALRFHFYPNPAHDEP
jgi:hypothetical protein